MRESFESSELSVSSRSLGYLDHPDCQYYQPRPYFFRLGQEFLRGPGRHGRIILFYLVTFRLLTASQKLWAWGPFTAWARGLRSCERIMRMFRITGLMEIIGLSVSSLCHYYQLVLCLFRPGQELFEGSCSAGPEKWSLYNRPWRRQANHFTMGFLSVVLDSSWSLCFSASLGSWVLS